MKLPSLRPGSAASIGAEGRNQNWPLSWRLTLFSMLVLCTVLTGLYFLIMAAIEEHFIELDRAQLADKMQQVSAALQRQQAPQEPDLWWALYDAQGKLERASPGFSAPGFIHQGAHDILEWKSSTPHPPAHQGQEHGQGHVAGHGAGTSTNPSRKRALFSKIKLQGTEQGLLVAISTLHHDHFEEQMKTTLWAYILAATLAGGALNWWAAQRGLSPLWAMRARAQKVSASQLDTRMPVAAVPVEMADLAQSLNDMLQRLQDDFQRLSDFSSDLAHELRTPLSNMLTQTQVALSQARSSAEYQDILASNAEELQNLARMVADMLFLAKTEHSLHLPDPQWIDLEQEVLALFEFYEALAQDKQVVLQLRGSARLYGDKLMLRRALGNLLSNAVRHSPPGQTVAVEIENTQDAGVEAERGPDCHIRISNLAPDLNPDLLPRLFDRFFRANQARSRPESEGTGLGLAITRAIVHAHGGQISVRMAGQRIVFEMQLPGAVF